MLAIILVLLWSGSYCLAGGKKPTVHACTCSSGLIDVHIDVDIAVDPSVLVPLSQTELRRQEATFKVFGRLCHPVGVVGGVGEFICAKQSNTESFIAQASVQLLLHGFTYSSQYWHPQWYGFQNYSYVDFSCSQGVSTFSYDNVCTCSCLFLVSTFFDIR